MNRSKLKLTTIIALTAFTVAVIPACLQRKSANAASKYTYKKGFTYEKISPNIEKRITGKSYRKNKNIKLSDLRYVQVLHYGFDGKVKEGELIVNKKIAKKTVKVFYALYQKKYRIERMRLIDDYGANDEKSMAANNTSAFNYRVISGTTKLSNHSYGMARVNTPLDIFISVVTCIKNLLLNDMIGGTIVVVISTHPKTTHQP